MTFVKPVGPGCSIGRKVVQLASYRRYKRVKRESSDNKKQFAVRLTGLMLDKGFTSERAARSGVDVSVVARLLGVTFEMARRYCDGTSMPGPEKLKKLAGWLGVRVAWLQYGEGPRWVGQADAAGDLDPEVLEFAKKLTLLRSRDRGMMESILDTITSEAERRPRLKVHHNKK